MRVLLRFVCAVAVAASALLVAVPSAADEQIPVAQVALHNVPKNSPFGARTVRVWIPTRERVLRGGRHHHDEQSPHGASRGPQRRSAGLRQGPEEVGCCAVQLPRAGQRPPLRGVAAHRHGAVEGPPGCTQAGVRRPAGRVVRSARAAPGSEQPALHRRCRRCQLAGRGLAGRDAGAGQRTAGTGGGTACATVPATERLGDLQVTEHGDRELLRSRHAGRVPEGG